MGTPYSDSFRALAYATGAAVGTAACASLVQERISPLVASLMGDLAATTSIFAFSLAANNSCVYDAYWPFAPIPIAAYWLSLNPKPSLAAYTGFGLLAAWALRYLCLEDPSSKVDHEDWRYADIRKKTGPFYWPVSLVSLHLTPTAVVFLSLSPLYPLLTGRAAGPLIVRDKYFFLASAAVAAGAIALQAKADDQLAHFRKTHADKSEVLESGVWAYSRHPNYFGEFLFWTGVCGMGLSAGVERWMCLGVPTLFCFFRFASIPLMDDRMHRHRPDYAATIRRVSAFIPWFRGDSN